MEVFRRFPTIPTLDPECHTTLHSLCTGTGFDTAAIPLSSNVLPITDPLEGLEPWEPFTNYSSAALMGWHYSQSASKSASETNRLARSLSDGVFDPTELVHFNVDRENKQIDSFIKNSDTVFQKQHGWQEASVKIRLPCSQVKFSNGELDAPEFVVDGIHHRRLIDIIKGKFIPPRLPFLTSAQLQVHSQIPWRTPFT